MYIYPTTQYTLKAPTPSFKSLGYTPLRYTDVNGIVRETQNTTAIRNDLDYNKLAKIIQTRFDGYSAVNILPMNVSDGTEAYCVANALIRNEGLENFKKRYAKIHATDVCRDVIENYGQKGLLHLYNEELSMFKNIGIEALQMTDRDFYKDYVLFQSHYPDRFYKLNPEYSKLFDFKTMDLQERLKNLDDKGNSVVFIRNCLRQSFGDSEAPKIIIQAAKKLVGKSLFITGDYDMESNVIKRFVENCFIPIAHNIWGVKPNNVFHTAMKSFH